jgi:hypothetical protein
MRAGSAISRIADQYKRMMCYCRFIRHHGGMTMTPYSKLNLQRMTEQRNELRALLQDAYDIISAQHDPDCEAWLGQARAALAKMAVTA